MLEGVPVGGGSVFLIQNCRLLRPKAPPSTLEEELDKLGCHYEEDFSPTW